jgi:hypothetical protein
LYIDSSAGLIAMISPLLRTILSWFWWSEKICSENFEKNSGAIDSTSTPSNWPFLKIGRVSWTDHLPETLPLKGLLMNRRS